MSSDILHYRDVTATVIAALFLAVMIVLVGLVLR
jgi:hypothetical protein